MDESVNFILNDKKPKKSIINLFLKENALLIKCFFPLHCNFGD